MTKNRIRFAFIMMFTVAIGFSMTACGSKNPKPQQTDPAVEAAAEEIVEAVKAEAEKEEDEIAKVNIIVPHSQGHQSAVTGVYPCYYEITYQKGR